MDTFEGVTVVRKANIYFEGKVTSRTIIFPDNTKKTLGIAQPGEYTFSTDAAEVMEILSGETDVRIGEGAWQSVHAGSAFTVPGKTSFTMRVTSLVDYCCSFLA